MFFVGPQKKNGKHTHFHRMIRKVILGSGALVLVSTTVSAKTPLEPEIGPDAPPKPSPMRISDLPLYEAPHAKYFEYVEAKRHEKKFQGLRSYLMEPVRSTRQKIQTAFDHTSAVTHYVSDSYHNFQDNTAWIVSYLREEENKQQRIGAVVMGGLTGFIFGLRGGIIRRLLYAGLGTTAMGAVCFPEETRDLAHNNGQVAKQYLNIAYNFVYGVKPGDPQLEIHFPELSFPKNFSEFVDMTVSLGSTLKQAVLPPTTKEDSKPEENKQ